MANTDMRCINCRWWEHFGDVWGECHRRSPEVDQEEKKGLPSRKYPHTHRADFCGDYELDVEE